MNTIKITRYKKSDLHLVSKWRSDDRINGHIRPGRRTPEEVQEWFGDHFSGKENQMHLISYESIPIGYFTIEGIDTVNRRCEFGIVIGEPDYHNKGIGTSAVCIMLQKAFSKMGMYRVFAGIEEGNTASIKCFSEAGFSLEGKLREVKIVGDKYKAILLFSILEQEWRGSNVRKIL